MEYRYKRGTRTRDEAVEFDVIEDGKFVTTCTVEVDRLLCNIKDFPCANGRRVQLTPKQKLEILEAIQTEREKIRDSYRVKTLAGWRESGLRNFESFCRPGDEVDDAMVEYFVNAQTPTLHGGTLVQDGEVYSYAQHENHRARPTFATFHRVRDNLWTFEGYCFKGERINRETGPSLLKQRIAEARKEIK